VPGTLIAKNLMLAHKWGLKTLYYSLIDKIGSRSDTVQPQANSGSPTNTVTDNANTPYIDDDEDSCESCKL
jgi:hypothetical protein